jgi:hypothetical protein
LGSVLGALRVNFHDSAADTNGKFRLTPRTKGAIAAGNFLHATMETDIFSSLRRYPQLMISDQDAPVQPNLVKGSTLLLQAFAEWPIEVDLQLCDHRPWDVNNQCPRFELFKTSAGQLSPRTEISEKSGLDWRVRFDVYASTKRVFLFTDSEPYACVDLPGAGLPEGPATVTFGDVLYHSGVDLDQSWVPFHRNPSNKEPSHMLMVGQRNFDNLGFSSGVAAPPWDFARFPCQAQFKQ